MIRIDCKVKNTDSGKGNVPPGTEKITEDLEKILHDTGISVMKDYNLILWNDHVNNMFDVVVALHVVCKLSNEDCERVMLEAHTKGSSVAKNGGDIDEMLDMKSGLNARGLDATVELAV
jgi:ATP-dependent Clp protease adapter protein ClpS